MDSKIDLKALQSERRNQNSHNIDVVTTLELCQIINKEDQSVATSITPCLSVIAEAIDALAIKVKSGGRILYVGAGTSGRLGVLDASELPPTYSADPQKFIAIIAGGDAALRIAQEGAEDDTKRAVVDLKNLELDGTKDALIGIAASGRTPYVLSCLEYAKSIGCLTVAISCCSPSEMRTAGNVDYMIEAITGAEVVTGSTRMKAGSATKMVLNMLSTGVMIKLGKTYGNMMVDVRSTNLKLEQRARNIIREVCRAEAPTQDAQIDALLKECSGSVKLAIAAILLHQPVSTAARFLQEESGVLASTLNRNVSLGNLSSQMLPADNAMRRYVLCVDGGGSKCAATILDDQNNVGVGISAGCNVSNEKPDTAVENITAAVHKAMQDIPTLSGRSLHEVEFSEALVGLAGFDRQPVADQISNELKSQLRINFGGQLKICTDVELAATVAGRDAETNHVLVLIAGTGSVAMAYRRDGGSLQRTARRGGWGPLFGDDGSGFDIGRKAIRHALAMVEADSNQLTNGICREEHDRLTEAIIDHLQTSPPATSNQNLLSSIITPFNASTAMDSKKRIADVAQIVLELSATDHAAGAIVDLAASEIAGLAQNMVKAKVIEPSTTVLAVTGGLMKHDAFRQKVLQRLTEAGSHFKEVLHIIDPARNGADFLKARLRAQIL